MAVVGRAIVAILQMWCRWATNHVQWQWPCKCGHCSARGLSCSQNGWNRCQIHSQFLAGEKRLLSASRTSTALLPRSCLFAFKAGGKSSRMVCCCASRLESVIPSPGKKCRHVAQAHFGCLWGANSFRTPPGGRGFKAHHDEVEARPW